MFKRLVPNPDIQYESPEKIKAYQEARLAEAIDYAAERSAYYRRVFAQNGIDPKQIRTIDDLQRLPVTTKADLQRHNRDFICVSPREVVDYVTTSGTLGEPVTVALTEWDLQRLAYNEFLSFLTAGCTPDDVMQLMVTLDRRFMAGLAYFMGARRLGMASSRVGNGIPELQWDTIRRIGSTCGMVIPSFLLKLIDFAERNGIDYRSSTFRKCICIGEALRKPDGDFTSLGAQIAAKWPELQLYTTYASTEMQTSFTDCGHFCGGHLQPELIVVEFLDDDNRPVPCGEPGEVTITNLGVEGMPLIRFKTGDICYHYTDRCACGRQTVRLSSVLGRKGQMIKYKGTTLYPPSLYDILNGIRFVRNYVVEVSTNSLGTDELTVIVGVDDEKPEYVKEIKDIFRSRVRVAPNVVFRSPDEVQARIHPATSRKPVFFFDLR